jgi:hypothetical protein
VPHKPLKPSRQRRKDSKYKVQYLLPRASLTPISASRSGHCLTPYLQSFPEIRDLPIFEVDSRLT